jgi:nucleotide-binding universal stress UspA family protein
MIPPRSILAAVDFSEPSRTALDFAARLARQAGAALHVVHAEDPLLAAGARSAGIDLSTQTREELARFVSPLWSGGAPARYHIVTGGSVTAICAVAAREHLDLVVAGAHGMSGAARAVFGSTTEGVLRHANTSVLVVPDNWKAPAGATADLTGVGPVVAAVEQSEAARAGAAAACRLAALLRTSVELVHVVPAQPVLDRWRGHAAAGVSTAIEDARLAFERLITTLDATVPVTLHVDSGNVPLGIARAAAPEAGRQPLLVLGRRDAASRLGAPGATAYRVLTLTHVPVLLHLPDRAGPAGMR